MNDETIDPAVPSPGPEPFSIWPEPREGAPVGLIAVLYAALLLVVVGLFGLAELFAAAPAYD